MSNTLTALCCTTVSTHAVVCAAFRLKRICEIYSKVLGTEEALHVRLQADHCAAADWFVRFTLCLLLCISRCTMRRRTGVRRSTLGAATQPISPQESWHSLAGNSLSLAPPQAKQSRSQHFEINSWLMVMNELELSSSGLSRAQGAEAAFWQAVLCRHRDGHRVERLHGGCRAGWRASSQRGQAPAQHRQLHVSFIRLESHMLDASVRYTWVAEGEWTGACLLLGSLCHGQTPQESDLANGAWVPGEIRVVFAN